MPGYCLKLGHDHFHIIYNSPINKQSLPAESLSKPQINCFLMYDSSSAGERECSNTLKLVSVIQHPGNFCPLISQLWIKICACECTAGSTHISVKQISELR